MAITHYDLPFSPGDTVRDTVSGAHIQILDVLGEGAYAVVYLVKNLRTNKKHALKCLSKRGLSWEQLQLQREEALLHKGLGKHVNIVHLEHYFENKDWLFLVLEYCPGRDLFCWISERRDQVDADGSPRPALDRDRVVKDVFCQVLQAVAYCHSRGVYHRDIKSENFIICDDGVVKLTDFGLATTHQSSIDFDCGSKPYMSPECNAPLNPTYSPRFADVWSLGVLLLTLVYRKTPWNAPAPAECPLFAKFRLHPERFLTETFGCESKLAAFLVRRVFTTDENVRILAADWLKLWYDDQLMTTTPSTIPIVIVRKHSNRPKLLVRSAVVQASSAPTPWAEMEEAMDFSLPVFDSDADSPLPTPTSDTFPLLKSLSDDSYPELLFFLEA